MWYTCLQEVNRMESPKFKHILEIIAHQHNTSVDEVRKEMQSALEEGQKSNDPAVQALWASIPRKGAELTLEEFIAYVSEITRPPLS